MASAPVSASFPRSERSTTNVLTDETLALLEAGQSPPDLALELVEHTVAWIPGRERAAHHRRLLGAIKPLEQAEQTIEIERKSLHRYALGQIMPLADDFQELIDALPSDWTDLELDLRIDEDRYVDAATLLVTCNAQPYSNHDWHFHLLVAHQFGHAASAPTTHGTLRLLDEAGIDGELILREVRAGRVEVTQMWGRPESVRQEFRRIRSQ